ncbi:MAG: discoidin domain-containing protein, partial [Sedimentisphaerales bacterium]
PLKKYLMCITDGWPTVAKMNSYILESDKITGPWKLVTYMKEFGEQGYFLNFPSKFISKDGLTLWLCYSGNFSQGWNNIRFKAKPPGSRYGLVLQQVKLLNPAMLRQYKQKQNKPQQQKDPLKSSSNIAPKAKVTASSTHKDYSAEAAIDRVVGGYPEDTSAEWASNGEKASASLQLSWDKSQTINRIWLFDRPNTNADQVTAGTLTFSDGSSINVGELPDDASAAKEITFPPKEVTWLKFVVTSVKPETQNIGLAEIAVFTAEE